MRMVNPVLLQKLVAQKNNQAALRPVKGHSAGAFQNALEQTTSQSKDASIRDSQAISNATNTWQARPVMFRQVSQLFPDHSTVKIASEKDTIFLKTMSDPAAVFKDRIALSGAQGLDVVGWYEQNGLDHPSGLTWREAVKKSKETAEDAYRQFCRSGVVLADITTSYQNAIQGIEAHEKEFSSGKPFPIPLHLRIDGPSGPEYFRNRPLAGPRFPTRSDEEKLAFAIDRARNPVLPAFFTRKPEVA